MLKILFFFLITLKVEANDSCEFYNIFEKPVKSGSCNVEQKLFGYDQFNSENSQFKYEFNKKFNIYLLELYNKEILNFLEKFCINDDDLKIKEITNLNKNGNSKFSTEVVVSCKFKLNE